MRKQNKILKIKAVYITLSLVFMVAGLEAQVYKNKLDSLVVNYRIRQGEKAFDNLAYAKSIRRLAPVYEKGQLADTLKGELAQAYLKVSETEKAENVYASINDQLLNGDDLFFYAQALKYNGKYAEADRYMARYLQSNANDSRAVKQNNALPVIEKILAEERYLIEEVDFNSKQSDFGAYVVDDEVVFASARHIDYIIRREYAWKETPYLNLFSAKIKDTDYSKPEIYSTELKSMYHDGPVCLSADGSELYLTRNNFNNLLPKAGTDGYNHLKLMVAHKQLDGQWGKPVDLPFNGDNFSTGHAFISADGETLYFASDREGSIGGSDIWYVKRQENGWSEPVNMGTDINTEGDEMFPFMDAENRFYFASNGHLGLGGLDLFVAAVKGDGFEVRNMGYPINSEKDDFSLYLQQDGVNGYFASNRAGGTGDDDIYRFKILKEVAFKKHLKSKLIDKNTRQVIANTPVKLLNKDGQILVELVSDKDGLIATELASDVSRISLAVNTPDYFPYEEAIDVSVDVDQHEMELIPRPFYGIYGSVYLLPDMTTVPEVTLTIEAKNKIKDSIVSDLDGGFKTKLEPETEYDLVFTKQKFFTKRVSYSTVGRDTGYVNLNEFMELELEEAKVGKSIEIEILYDLGKWNIREDAAQELDDMIQFLNDNPTIKIELGSHTDARGSSRANMALSQKRAESAVQYMVDRGIAQDRIQARGYGETRLKNRCADGVQCSEEEHQANRRSEVTIIAM